MWLQEYREAFDPETAASRPVVAPRADAQGVWAYGDTPDPVRPAERHTAPRDEWADLYASPIDTPDWRLYPSPAMEAAIACPHHAIREHSIGGILTERQCIDCSTHLPDRSWDD